MPNPPPPKTNEDFWRNKALANSERDADTNRRLALAGWEVLRFWSHESPELVAGTIAESVQRASVGV